MCALKCPSSRLSRHKKRYWRRGTHLDDVEESLYETAGDEAAGGAMDARSDGDLFVIDRSTITSEKKLTRRQRVALAKRAGLPVLTEDKSKEVLSKEPSGSRRQPRKKSTKGDCKRPAETPARPYDLWTTDLDARVSLSDAAAAAEHYLLGTRQKQPRMPHSVKHVTSVLRHVAIPHAASSYNPPAQLHQKWLQELAGEEARYQQAEERTARALALPPGLAYVSQEERRAEEMEGLDGTEGDESEEDNEVERDVQDKTGQSRKGKKKRKTRAIVVEKGRDKAGAKRLNDVFRTRTLNRELSKTEMEREQKAVQRREIRRRKRLTSAQRLGKGAFTVLDEPFLLDEELVGSLRELQPQGSVIQERLNSLQKRNVIPVAVGRQRRSKLKKKLRVKEQERRSYKQVTIGSRVL